MKRSRPYFTASVTAIVLLAFFASVFAVSCMKKEMAGELYTVSGRIYSSCDRIPYAHQTIQLVKYTSTSSCFAGASPVATTDGQGYFSFSYRDECTDYSFTDEYQIVISSLDKNGKIILSRIPGKSNLDVGEMYVDNVSSVHVTVNVSAFYPVTDTLYFGTGKDDFYAINPVQHMSGVFGFIARTPVYANKTASGNFFYAVGYKEYQHAVTAPSALNSLSFRDEGCNGVTDTVTISLP